ncbi:hypothetical protein Dsin_007221 [Dipteronia sinensis]|uniref:Uncharacterized protein n=1 Tax=Dipteronia sinensis TaxID=43782 RepID=A0AAE0B1F5_9ROSI|nr:hypothetical protein Dsin_007221 [Dipteronia sinensis]
MLWMKKEWHQASVTTHKQRRKATETIHTRRSRRQEEHITTFGVVQRPRRTKSLALVVEDIDAPDPNDPIVPWTHWVVVNIPPSLKGLPEGFSGKEEEVGGDFAAIKEGKNDWKVPDWRGPKLPNHGHRIQFKLYALDDEMHLGNTGDEGKIARSN